MSKEVFAKIKSNLYVRTALPSYTVDKLKEDVKKRVDEVRAKKEKNQKLFDGKIERTKHGNITW